MIWLRATAILLSSFLILPVQAQSRLAARTPGAAFGMDSGLGIGAGMGMGLDLGPGLDHVQQVLDTRGSRALNGVDQGTVRDLMSRRASEARKLLREHGDVLEADPQGNPVVRHEILATFPNAVALSRALALGFEISRDRVIPGVGMHVVALSVPPHWSLEESLRVLRESVPAGTYDYDQIYFRAGSRVDSGAPPVPATDRATTASARSLPKLGLIDTGIDTANPAFRHSILHAWGCGGAAAPGPHGTEVASLLVRNAPAELYSADVYCGAPTGGSAGTVIAAFAWMARERVPVINVSLVGPKNLLLAQVVSALIANGFVIVAAVGNDGPAAPPLYPAAYPNVIGVTAVDDHRHVLLEAERGPQVTFAALGADVEAAGLRGRTAEVRGTSFAAPVVAALFAVQMRVPDPRSAAAARTALIARAIDLGARGWDPVYGYGLLGAK